MTQQIHHECINPIPASSSGIQLTACPSNGTVTNSHIDGNLPTSPDTTPQIYKNNASVASTALCETPANVTRNLSFNTLSSTTNASNQLVLVPLSMLNLHLSNNLEICQFTKSGPPSEAVPRSRTEFIGASSANKKYDKSDLATQKKARQKNCNSCNSYVAFKKRSSVKKDEAERSTRQGAIVDKRNMASNVVDTKRSKQRQRDKISPKTGSNLKKSVKERSISESEYCLVCGEKAGKHLYYGGRSCQSCRAFFRRSVERITKYVVTVNAHN